MSFVVVDRTIEEGTPEDTAMICVTSTSQALNGSIRISDIGNAGVDSMCGLCMCMGPVWLYNACSASA